MIPSLLFLFKNWQDNFDFFKLQAIFTMSSNFNLKMLMIYHFYLRDLYTSNKGLQSIHSCLHDRLNDSI